MLAALACLCTHDASIHISYVFRKSKGENHCEEHKDHHRAGQFISEQNEVSITRHKTKMLRAEIGAGFHIKVCLPLSSWGWGDIQRFL
jgi:hypothetical protein